MIKRILVGLGGTPFTPVAVQRAVELAKRYDAEITGVTVVNLQRLAHAGPVPLGTGHQASEHRIAVTQEKVEAAIHEFESSCDAAGIKHRTHREEASEPFQLMISMARYHDLMIFGLRSIFEYGMATEDPRDTLVRLVSAGVRPIIAVSEHYRPIRKALIAYSGSMESAKTMKRFIQFCPWPNVEIKIMTFKPSEDVARQLLQDASEYCRAHGFTVETEDNPGIPKDLLFVAASLWGADLLVIGNSARNLLLKRILGETALDVIQNADRPLFLCQ